MLRPTTKVIWGGTKFESNFYLVAELSGGDVDTCVGEARKCQDGP